MVKTVQSGQELCLGRGAGIKSADIYNGETDGHGEKCGN
jgi:hypothetical protein